MRQPALLAGLVVVGLLVGSAANDLGAQPDPGRKEGGKKGVEDAQQAVRQVVDGLHAALLKATDPAAIEKVGPFLDDDLVLVDSSGRRFLGKQEFLKLLALNVKLFQENMTDLQWDYDIQSIRVIGSMAAVFGEERVSYKMKTDGKVVSRETWATWVLQKKARQWVVIQAQSTAKAPAAPGTLATPAAK